MRSPGWVVKAQLGVFEGLTQGDGLCRQTVAQPCVEHDAARYARTYSCNSHTLGILQCHGCIVLTAADTTAVDTVVCLRQVVRRSWPGTLIQGYRPLQVPSCVTKACAYLLLILTGLMK